VADSSVLIGLEQVGQLDLLRLLFSVVHLPPSVVRETDRSVPRYDWLRERPLRRTVPSLLRRSPLDRGEADAISLALEDVGEI
jgi:predicted nucleic acid-binding protein